LVQPSFHPSPLCWVGGSTGDREENRSAEPLWCSPCLLNIRYLCHFGFPAAVRNTGSILDSYFVADTTFLMGVLCLLWVPKLLLVLCGICLFIVVIEKHCFDVQREEG